MKLFDLRYVVIRRSESFAIVLNATRMKSSLVLMERSINVKTVTGLLLFWFALRIRNDKQLYFSDFRG